MLADTPGSFQRRRPLSVCGGSGVSNIYLNRYNRSMFEKNTPMEDLGPFCALLGQNGDQNNQSATVPFNIEIRG